MYDPGTVICTDIIVRYYNMGLLVLSLRFLFRSFVKRLIGKSHQVLTLTGFQDRIGFFSFLCQTGQYRIQSCYSQNIKITVRSLYLGIFQIRMYAKRHIGRKSPGGCGPSQEIALFSLDFKANNRRTFLHFLVTLSYLMGGKGGSATGTIGYNFKALVQELLLPNFL